MRPRLALGLLATLMAAALAGWWLSRPESPATLPELEAPPAPTAAAAAETPSVPAPAAAGRQTIEQATLKSGRTLRIVRRAATALPVGALGPLYAKLAEEAASGNSVSNYRLGMLLYECHDIPADPAALDRAIEAVHQTRRADGFDVASPAEEEKRLRSRYQDCDGVPAAERGRYREHLKAAADAGVIEAQLNLPLKLPPGEWCQYLSECAPEQRAAQEALQKEAIDYVGRAREAGSAAALWTFAGWYAEGEVLPRDDVEAYAHFKALDEINEATRQPRRFDRLLASLRRRLRPVDLDRADSRASELLANPNCCVITP